MQTRRLGRTDLELTTLGLGSWAIGGPYQFGWGPQDDNDSMATIIETIEAGINWIDTAAIYGCGHSEVIVGRAIKEFGQRPLISTKCGLRWDDKREKVNLLKKESIIEECEDSLKRLDIDAIDLYQMHWPIPDEGIEEAWGAMKTLTEQGKVRYIGVSNFNVSQLQRAANIHPVASLQPPYSMLKREIESEILPFCKDNNIGVICYSPMQRGLLTGKFNKEKVAALASDDHRRNVPEFNEPELSANLRCVERLKPIAEDNNITLAQLAIAWTLRDDVVTAAIAGARRKGQISETVKAADVILSEQDIDKIKVLLKERDKELR